MAFDLSQVFSDIADAEISIAAAGVLVVGVWVAVQAFQWIQVILSVRRELRDDFRG